MTKQTMNPFSFTVDTDNIRVDLFVSQKMQDISRSRIASLAENGHVMCNGKPVLKSYKLKQGDTVTVDIPPAKELDVIAQDIPIEIAYEDDYLLIVNKNKGIVVHPSPGNENGTLVNAVLHHCKGKLSEINGVLRPGIVHRIDKNTSGLLVIAKDNDTHAHLAKQFAQHSITREYYAVVYGRLKNNTGFVNAPIGRHPVYRKQMAINEKNGKNAYTSFEVIETYNGFSFIKVQLKTGRTHQIRVHMAAIGHPVAGDDVYGPKKCITKLNGQCLHAKTLGFIHPKSNEYIELTSELPQYFLNFLNGVKNM